MSIYVATSEKDLDDDDMNDDDLNDDEENDDDSGPNFLCSNRGWGDFIRWVETLNAGEFPDLAFLCETGETQAVKNFREQLIDALKKAPPSQDVRTVGESLIESATDEAPFLLITNGMS